MSGGAKITFTCCFCGQHRDEDPIRLVVEWEDAGEKRAGVGARIDTAWSGERAMKPVWLAGR